jgi:hypothetical protein
MEAMTSPMAIFCQREAILPALVSSSSVIESPDTCEDSAAIGVRREDKSEEGV